MTPDEVIALAREVGVLPWHWKTSGTEGLTRFAALIEAKVREECAKVCEETVAQHYMKQIIPTADEALLVAACSDCASAIRARGSKT